MSMNILRKISCIIYFRYGGYLVVFFYVLLTGIDNYRIKLHFLDVLNVVKITSQKFFEIEYSLDSGDDQIGFREDAFSLTVALLQP